MPTPTSVRAGRFRCDVCGTSFATAQDLRKHAPGCVRGERRAGGTEREPAVVEERIRRRAYEIFVARGGRPGSAEQDWFEAEREILGPGGRWRAA